MSGRYKWEGGRRIKIIKYQNKIKNKNIVEKKFIKILIVSRIKLH